MVTRTTASAFGIGLLGLLLSLALCLVAPASASAIAKPDLSERGSVTVGCTYDSSPISNAKCSLFEVAAFNSQGSFSLTSGFSGCDIDVSSLSTARDWRNAAQQAASYADAHQASGTAAETGALGTAFFGGLEPGLYLVRVSEVSSDGYRYVSAPSLVAVPSMNADESAWVYQVVALPKFERTAIDAEPGQQSGQASGVKDEDGAKSGLSKTGDVEPLAITVGILAMLVGAYGIAHAAWFRRKRSLVGSESEEG